METDLDKLPLRWRDLDKRTIEWIARLNEPERQRLIELSHMDEKQLTRLDQFLSLPDEKWDAGFRIVTRSVVITKAGKSILKMTLILAGFLVALNQIWGSVAPIFMRVGK